MTDVNPTDYICLGKDTRLLFTTKIPNILRNKVANFDI